MSESEEHDDALSANERDEDGEEQMLTPRKDKTATDKEALQGHDAPERSTIVQGTMTPAAFHKFRRSWAKEFRRSLLVRKKDEPFAQVQ